MCTVTWLFEPGGYQIFFNRDEKKTRLPARPPALHESEGVRLIYPVDGNSGGTWIGVNEFGISICLLNHHPVPPAPPLGKQTSRGHLVRALLTCRTREEIRAKLTDFKPANYRPFILIAFEPRPTPLALVSDGVSLRDYSLGDLPFVSTSSYQSVDVVKNRRNIFARLNSKLETRNSEQRVAFHRSHVPEKGPYSVCMHREDAQTVSFSHIRVSADGIQFVYGKDFPCRAVLMDPVEMPIRREPN